MDEPITLGPLRASRLAALDRKLARAGIALGLALFAVVVGSVPSQAESCIQRLPEDFADAQGYTFVGTLTGYRRVPADHLNYLEFAVGPVFAGGNAPPQGPLNTVLRPNARFELYTPPCDGIRNLIVGGRYLLSSRWVYEARSAFSAVWHLDGHAAELVRMFPQYPFDGRLARVATLREGVDLMVHGLPPTDADRGNAPAAGPPQSAPLDVALLGVAAFALICSRLGMRRRLN